MDVIQLKKRFMELFGGSGEGVRAFAAPGRVNLIGEHTDYNGGFVFPAAINMGTTVIARPRADRIVRLAATDIDGVVEASLDELSGYRNIKWGNYQLGVADELQKAGYKLTGCDMLYEDTVPHGAGLSSSAAIEVATALALTALGDENAAAFDGERLTEIARISQKAENNYVGVNCGIMDQFASAMGKRNHAIFLKCSNLDYKLIPLNLSGYRIIISNTNKKRSLADSKYNERRMECEKGFAALKQKIPGITCLGDVPLHRFSRYSSAIEDEVVRKRTAHVVAEDDRVLKSVEALHNGDIKSFGRLMTASHESLRDLYEVTGMELDTLVDEALKIEGVLGSRMTGAGFGGCTVSIVKEDAVEGFIRQVGAAYASKIGYEAAFYVTETGDGARELV